ncbi:hypothetical protein IE53DRAFT_361294 [Violaceomyces palustris]|uniref:Uncharacterized protein n=1 Tax=Violaceomyces palustris TaxID=1673888 RepID=A0ACD0P132_9BASI|nr:hypothetical protein IE53DRAFT_361294 [Violaceomyces palustris]
MDPYQLALPNGKLAECVSRGSALEPCCAQVNGTFSGYFQQCTTTKAMSLADCLAPAGPGDHGAYIRCSRSSSSGATKHVGKSKRSKIVNGLVLPRQGQREMTIDSSDTRIVTGTRSTPYDFNKSKNSDCYQRMCSNEGNGGLRGPTDKGCTTESCFKNNYCARIKGEAQVKIGGFFESRYGLDQTANVMWKALERTQAGKRSRLCKNCCADPKYTTTGSWWEDWEWSVPPFVGLHHTIGGDPRNSMFVNTLVKWEEIRACQAILNALGTIAGFRGNFGSYVGSVTPLIKC